MCQMKSVINFSAISLIRQWPVAAMKHKYFHGIYKRGPSHILSKNRQRFVPYPIPVITCSNTRYCWQITATSHQRQRVFKNNIRDIICCDAAVHCGPQNLLPSGGKMQQLNEGENDLCHSTDLTIFLKSFIYHTNQCLYFTELL